MITARAGPTTVRSPYEVTGYEPPGRLAGTGVAGPVRFQEEYRLTGDGAATILTQSIRATPAARSGWPRACCAASFRSSSPLTSAGSRTWWKPRSRTADLRPQTACHHVPVRVVGPARAARRQPRAISPRGRLPISAVPGRLRQRRYASLRATGPASCRHGYDNPVAAVRRAVDAINDRSIGDCARRTARSVLRQA